jgi:hypothetical protein
MQLGSKWPNLLDPCSGFTGFKRPISRKIVAGTTGMSIEAGDSRRFGLHHPDRKR